jgi:hypothetical protein
MSAANIDQIANALLQKLALSPGSAASAVNILKTCFEIVNGMLTTSTVEDKKVVLIKVMATDIVTMLNSVNLETVKAKCCPCLPF